MYDGKKSVALAAFYDAMEVVAKKTKESGLEPLEYWKRALENITPNVEVKSRRVGGATFQVPTEIRQDRKVAISIKNLVEFARKRSGRSMSEKLAAEIVAAYNSEGGAFKRKEDTHRMADANKAFSHFRF
jgi:small subunit ribosomal protein S7